MHNIKKEQLGQQNKKPMNIFIKKMYPHKTQKMSRWEQWTNNHQGGCVSAFLSHEAEQNNAESHGPEIRKSLKISEGTSLEIKTGSFHTRK